MGRIINAPSKYSAQIKHKPMRIEKLITVMTGEPHTGKTHRAIDAGYAWISDKPKATALFLNMENWLKDISVAYHDNKPIQSILDLPTKVDLLIMDDLWANDRHLKDHNGGRISDMIRNRMDASKTTIITTNCTFEDLTNLNVDQRLLSRLDPSNEHAKWILYKSVDSTKKALEGNWEIKQPAWYYDAIAVASDVKKGYSGWSISLLCHKMPEDGWIWLETMLTPSELQTARESAFLLDCVASNEKDVAKLTTTDIVDELVAEKAPEKEAEVVW